MTTSGTVQGLLPIVPVSVIDKEGTIQRFRAALDTGFNGSFALPPSSIRRLGLTALESRVVTFANGESEECPVYAVAVIWNGERVSLPVFGLGDTPLIGMALLRGSRVTMDVVEGGAVEIEPL